MNDYEMLSKAFKLSCRAHETQRDKAGQPYIYHPVMVALQCDTVEEKVVALLHDSVEDKGLTFDDIRESGFSEDIIDSVRLLTHEFPKDDEYDRHYREYIKALYESGDQTAINVKIADLTHNTDLSRLGGRKSSGYDRYIWAIEYLKGN